MKQLITCMLAAALTIAAAPSAGAQTRENLPYGQKFEVSNPVKAEGLMQLLGDKTSVDNVVVAGMITEVCQKEGCWLKIRNGEGDPIFVKMKDHAFLVPKDIAGKMIFINGKVIKKTVSVEEQKHYMEDAGRSPSDIASVTAPKDELRIEATGVIVQ